MFFFFLFLLRRNRAFLARHVEDAARKPKDIQSAIRIAHATGGIAAGAVKGSLVSKLTAKGALLTNVISPAP